jgi:signal transduction histidine kinase
LLARLLQECRDEIADEWLRLIASDGLPGQQRRLWQDPAGLRAGIDRILNHALAYLCQVEPAARATAREALLALYRGFGREWAEREGAAPARAVGPPRSMEATSRVILRRYAPELPREELLDCVAALNALIMDLAMARMYGYLSYKEEVLATQQQTVLRLADELARVETKERRSLALELHDGLAQSLVSLYSGIQHAERLVGRDADATSTELQRLGDIAQATIREARGMIRDLHFGVTGQGGGFAALGDYIADLEADGDVRHEIHLAGFRAALPPAQEALLMRIIQEALINAHKHAGARSITITVAPVDGGLSASVTDDGCGFRVEEALARSRRRGRFGLIGMHERAQLLGATLVIESAPGQGTSVRLTVPRAARDG